MAESALRGATTTAARLERLPHSETADAAGPLIFEPPPTRLFYPIHWFGDRYVDS
jgi:hypothetical protein